MLRPNHAYTPRLEESMTRLASWMPFQRAATELEFFSGVAVAEATVRRITQAAGAASVAVQEAVVVEARSPRARGSVLCGGRGISGKQKTVLDAVPT